ncbi:hypothetical protein SK128_008154, partial [Halocaridina rubra]
DTRHPCLPHNTAEAMSFTLYSLFRDTATKYPENLAILDYTDDDQHPKEVSYRKLHTESTEIFKICKTQIGMCTTLQVTSACEFTCAGQPPVTDISVDDVNRKTKNRASCHDNCNIVDLPFAITIIAVMCYHIPAAIASILDRVFGASPLTFDPSVVNIFLAFNSGAGLVLVHNNVLKKPDLLLNTLIQSKSTVFQATPSLVYSLGKERLKRLIKEESHLRILALGGEPFPNMSLVREWIGTNCKIRIFNLYGITEISCWASVAEISVRELIGEENGTEITVENISKEFRENSSEILREIGTQFDLQIGNEVSQENIDISYSSLTSIGKPLDSTVIRVVNNSDENVSEGRVGEIVIGSCERICLIDDYSPSDIKQTREFNNSLQRLNSFTESCLVMRRTGDKGVIHNGKIYCLGRVDRQVKRLGQKVSLAEIERHCESISYVEVCRVIACNETKIIAFVQLCNATSHSEDDIVKKLTRLLSPWKMPDDIIIVNSLPFNNHGKVDDSQLTLLTEKKQHKCILDDPVSLTSIQKLLVKFWRRYLGTKHVSDQDNFISSGGNSLNAMCIITELEHLLNIEMPMLLDILLNRTLSEVLDHISNVNLHTPMPQDSRILMNIYKKQKLEGTEKDMKRTESPVDLNTINQDTHKVVLAKKDNTDKVVLDGVASERVLPKIVSRRGVFNLRHISQDEGSASDKKTIMLQRYEANKVECAPREGHKIFSLQSCASTTQKTQILTYKSTTNHDCKDIGGKGFINMKDFAEREQIAEAEYTLPFRQNMTTPEYMGGKSIQMTNLNNMLQGDRNNSSSDCRLEHCITDYTADIQWKVNLGKCIDSSPTLVEFPTGRTFILVGSHSHRFTCIDVDSACELWSLTLGDRIESSPCLSMDGNFVYVGCYDYNLYGVKLETGEVVWKYTTGGEIKSSPIVDEENGNIIFGCHDKHLYCLKANGSLLWKRHLSNGSIFSSPCIIENQVFAATLDGVVCGIRKKCGVILWLVNLVKPIFSSLTPYSKGLIFGNVDNKIFAYTNHGMKLWEFKTNGPVFSTAFVKKCKNLEVIAIGCHDHRLYIFNSLGHHLVTYCGTSPIYATPFMYSFGNDIRVVVCETSGKFCIVKLELNQVGNVVDLKTRNSNFYLEKVLESVCNGEIFSSPIVHQSKLYICCRDDNIYCIKIVSK